MFPMLLTRLITLVQLRHSSFNPMKEKLVLTSLRALLIVSVCAIAATATAGHVVTAEVRLVRSDNKQPLKDLGHTVAWLVPSNRHFILATSADPHFRMMQKDKKFEPDLLVVPTGSYVDFPNLDPWFHNVFSLFRGKRFDLGLYQAGAQRSVRFDKPGVSYLFCNIHPQMSAVVLSVDSRWYGVSDAHGRITFSDVPDGTYILHVWHENASPEALKSLEREVEVSGDRALTPVTLDVQPQGSAHKNKYGSDYEPDGLKPEY